MLAPRVVVVASLCSFCALAQPKTVSEDKEWSKPAAALTNSLEAEFIVRVGDVDNLNFGWPDDFDPFCGRMTQAHGYPWEPLPTDLAGTDRILLSSKLKRGTNGGCGSDGYSGTFDPKKSKPVPLVLPTTILKDATVKNAFVQLFIDDFQAPSLCSKFQVTVNGKRFVEAEKVLNAIDQTGPVGKLISIPLPEEFWADLTGGKPLTLLVDETKGSEDGFALDFVRLLVNRKRENSCKGTLNGRVVQDEDEAPIAKARVMLADKTTVETDADGQFSFKDVPTGFEVVTASAQGYADGSGGGDVGVGDEPGFVTIRLKKGKALVFDKKEIAVGQAFNLSNILFDAGKADLKKESKPELDKVVAFLEANPGAEIELSGHTSSEGEAAMNRSLSYRRVKACKDYVVSKRIDAGRIIAVGYGPDRPVASNADEAGRKQNRRVELRVVKN